MTLLLTGVILTRASVSLTSFADEPYDVYNYDRWGEAVPSQAGYIADRSVSGNDLGVGSLNSPSDIFRDHNDIFYIADTGNNRIIAVDSEINRVIRIYDKFTMPDGSETFLKRPTGIFVSAENDCIYIADTENSRVLVCNYNAEVIQEIKKPVSGVYDQQKTFLPQRVLADKAGNVYVVLNNITTGAAMFSPDGDFVGFYGANRVEATAEIVLNHVKNLFASEKKKSRKARSVPTGITNFDIDGDFIFTCTASSTQKTDTVKKLNAAGKNNFADLKIHFGDIAPMYDTSKYKLLPSAIVDIDIDDDKNINCLDRTAGRIFHYDEECNLMFIAGTKADQLGGFNTVSAIESMGGNLYVVDSAKASVTVFTETSFGEIVHEAVSLDNAGCYEEALEPWLEVIKRDGNYRRAYIGAASALLRKGEYKEAMKYAKLADSPAIYNKAFEGYRRKFLQANFRKIAAVLIIFAAAMIFRGKRKKKSFDIKSDRKENAQREEEVL